MAPIFEDGNNKKDPPREEDLFETHSLEVESPKYSLDEVKAITHPGFGGPGRKRYRLAI